MKQAISKRIYAQVERLMKQVEFQEWNQQKKRDYRQWIVINNSFLSREGAATKKNKKHLAISLKRDGTLAGEEGSNGPRSGQALASGLNFDSI